MNFAAFFSYIIITAITPGPNNIMAMTNAAKYGFRRSFPFNVGVLFGFLGVMSVSALFASWLYELIPAIKPYMLWLGALYILWLAYSVWKSSKPVANDIVGDENVRKQGRLQTNTIFAGMILQFINVKVILYGLTALTSFVLPYYRGFAEIALFVVILSIVGFVGTVIWALFGAVFERFFKAYGRVINTVLALFLVYYAVMMIVDSFK